MTGWATRTLSATACQLCMGGQWQRVTHHTIMSFCIIYTDTSCIVTATPSESYELSSWRVCRRNRNHTRFAINLGFILVATRNFATDIGLLKIPCQTTRSQYMTLRLMCSVLRVQLRFLGPLFSETINSHRYVYYTFSFRGAFTRFRVMVSPYEASRSHALDTHHTRYDSSGRMISPTRKPPPDNRQYSKRQTSMSPAGFEPEIPESKRWQINALHRAANGISLLHYNSIFSTPFQL